MIIKLALTAIFFIPAAILAWYFLASRDGVREPISAVAEAFGFGLIAVVIALPLELLFVRVTSRYALLTSPTVAQILRLSIIIALIEEAAKFLPLALFINQRRYFNRVVDGVIYFALAGLAFGLVENILYVWRYGIEVGLYRAIILVFFHAATAGIVGYYFARAKVEGKTLTKTFIALGVMVILHAIYDTGLLLTNSAMFALSIAITAGINIALFFYFRAAVRIDGTRLNPRPIKAPANPRRFV